MFLNYVSGLFSSASQAFNKSKDTLPWIGAAYCINKFVISKLVPERFQSYAPYALPEINEYFGLPQPLGKIANGLGIVTEVNNFYHYSTQLTQSSKWSDRLYFLLLTYSTVVFAYDYFKELAPHTNENAETQKSANPTHFELGMELTSFAFQLCYATKSTIMGAAIGALMHEYKESLPDNEELQQFKTGEIFSNPTSITQKCQYIWRTLNFASTYISSTKVAFIGGLSHGYSLSACFRSYFPSKQPPAPTEKKPSHEDVD